MDKIAKFIKSAKIKGDIDRHSVVLKSLSTQNQFTHQELVHFIDTTIKEMKVVAESVLKDLSNLGEFTLAEPLIMVTKFGLMVTYYLRSTNGIGRNDMSGIFDVLKKHKLY